MSRIIFFVSFAALMASCTGGSGPQASGTPSAKSGNFEMKSAADIRREVAAASAVNKKFDAAAEVPSRVYYTCDRETLPRTCCYYILNGGGTVYGGSPSCTEENH